MLERVWRKGNPFTFPVGGNVNWYSHYENSMEVLKKTKHRTTTWPSNPTPGHISRENHNSKIHMNPVFTVALVTIARTGKQPKCPSTESERKWSRSVLSDSATPWAVAYQASQSIRFSKQEYWSGLSFPSPGDLPDPGMEPGSPALQADTLPSSAPRCYHVVGTPHCVLS